MLLVPAMRSPQTLTRRLVPALAVTVVSTLIFGAVVVTADAATADAPLLPDTFGVAAPMQGDAWRYNLTLHGGWTFGLDDEMDLDKAMPFGSFQWAGTGKVRGGDGLLHDGDLLYAEHLAYEPLWLEEVDSNGSFSYKDEDGHRVHLDSAQDPYWYEMTDSAWVAAGGTQVLQRGDRVAMNESYTNYGVPFTPGVMAEWSDSYLEAGAIEFPDGEGTCLALNPLQGGNVSLADDIELFQQCTLGGEFLSIPDGLLFHAAAIQNVSNVQAIRFDGSLNGTYSAWFTPAVPYPVRLEVSLPTARDGKPELGDRDLPGARSFVLDMVGFDAGSEPLLTTDSPSDPAPELAFAAPLMVGETRVGLDEADLAHPFPLSEAFQKALESTEFTDLQTYLASNPDGYVASATFTEGTDVYYGPASEAGAAYAYVWTIGMHNGREGMVFTAAKQDYSNGVPQNQGLRGLVANATAQQPVYSFQQGSAAVYYGPYDPYLYDYGMRAPSPGRLPTELPTAVSLMERWAAFDGSGTPANNYGFSFGCADDESEACDVEVTYFAGHSRRSSAGGMFTPMAVPTDPYGSESYMVIERSVMLRGDGVAQGLYVYDEREYRSAGGPTSQPNGGLPPPSSLNEPGYEIRSSEVVGIPDSSLAWLPEGKEAASVTFLGLIVGVLYWVWPKLGLVGLFSRLERGELLDHPARAKLVQIVEAQPGIHFHDLALKAELANGTAVHHLRKLSDSGHVSVRRSGRYTCYFPGGRVDPHVAAAAPLLKSDGAKQVLEAVRGKPGMSNLEVAQATGLQPSTVNYHVQRLSQAGLVAALRDGRMVRLHPGIRAGAGDPAPAAGAAA